MVWYYFRKSIFLLNCSSWCSLNHIYIGFPANFTISSLHLLLTWFVLQHDGSPIDLPRGSGGTYRSRGLPCAAQHRPRAPCHSHRHSMESDRGHSSGIVCRSGVRRMDKWKYRYSSSRWWTPIVVARWYKYDVKSLLVRLIVNRKNKSSDCFFLLFFFY